MKTKSILTLTGKTAFLNGQKGLHDLESRFCKSFENNGKEVLVLDNLFEQPEKLKSLLDCDNLVLSTTGMYLEDVNKLVDAFKQLNYVPKVVVFVTEQTAMSLLGVAREMKKLGTKFYFFDCLDNKSLQEINWIN
jgi:hypothetical protein